MYEYCCFRRKEIVSRSSVLDESQRRQATLDEGSMGILRWNGRADNSFALVADAWLHEYTPHTWRYL